jgi:cation diffusion facilitator CzcD-associated flavoprotein CzcO
MAKPAAVIVGAGIGGICAAIRLREAGYDNILIFDRNAGVGGVWFENRYPGCACDVPIPLYQLSFAPGYAWNHTFPRAAEIQSYVEGVVDQFQLRPSLRLSEAVVSARWDETAKLWHIETDKGATLEAGVLVAAMGQLNRPAWPDLPGRDSFKGRSTHAARWDDTITLKNKRVGVIGSAASAVQLIPEVAKLAKHLTVFQRTPNWVVPRNDQAITDEQKALFMTAPQIALKLGAAQREAIWENADYFFWQAFEWTPEGRAAFTRQARDHLEAQVPDPDLRARLTPDYPIGCKRILITDDFYPALMRGNVDLVTVPIDAINAWGVKGDDGVQHDLDVLIYATGFETTGWHWSMDVTGEGGTRLNTLWADHPEAYLGTTVAGFPNLFVLYGPNTNLGHNSIIYMLECQVEYMIKALQAAEKVGAKALSPTQAAQDRFNADLQARLAKTVWADPHCISWYKNAQGRITQNWYGPTRDFAAAVQTVELGDYALVR